MSKFFVSPVAALDGLLVDGMTILSYGLGWAPAPAALIARILDSGVRNLTVVTDDERVEGFALARLLDEGRVCSVIAPTPANPTILAAYRARKVALELAAPAALAERLVAGRLGVGSFLTCTATEAAEGRPLQILDGCATVRQTAVFADLALLSARQADSAGNLLLHDATAPNRRLATAARVAVAQIDEVVAGRLDEVAIHVRGLHIDRMVHGASTRRAPPRRLLQAAAAA